MLIAIPSAGRADKQRTLATLLEAGVSATLFIPKAERADYSGLNFIDVSGRGIGPTRQYIIDFAALHGFKKVLMLDDDLEFFVRRSDNKSKLIKATPAEVRKMIKEVEKQLDTHAHIGIATREGGNRNTNDRLYNTRLLRALGYRIDALHQHNIRFDRVPVMEDFDVALQLLELGYPSAQINNYLQDQPGSNVAGGCSAYRTPKVQAEGAKKLRSLHPDFVTLVDKPVPKSGGWFKEPRVDVKVMWKKAYESGGLRRDL